MLLILFIAILSILSTVSCQKCDVINSNKADCGYIGINKDQCEAKACCWAEAGEGSSTPWCYYSSSSGYALSDVMETSTGFKGLLNLIEGSSVYGSDIKSLVLTVTFDTTDIMHISITDASKQRWEIPQRIIARPTPTTKPPASSMKYKFSYTSSPFTFEVTRISDGVVIFKNDKPIVFKDQYIELTSSFDSSAKTYGIGESTRLNHALQAGHTYTFWAVDLPAASEQHNLYGSFPYYLQTINGVAHGAMLLNSNGMDVSLEDTSLTFKVIGGMIDLYIFAGDTPSSVVSQYTSIVGRPALVPYWSLGFHNCKYGYSSLQQVEDVVANYSLAGIPLETQWMDIDYMQDYRDFTTDAINFPIDQVASFVKTLHQRGQRFVPMVYNITTTNYYY